MAFGQTLIRRLLFASTMLVVSISSAQTEVPATVGVEISRIGEATHLEFKGAREWKYDLKRESDKGDAVVLRLAGLNAEALTKLRNLKDSLVTGVTIAEKGTDGAAEITFATSKTADFFDYISDQPSRLVVDFFLKEAPVEKKAEVATPEPKAVAQKLPAKVTKSVAKKSDREPAGTDGLLVAQGTLPGVKMLNRPSVDATVEKDFSHGIFDGGDPEFTRFMIKDYEVKQDSIIASNANYYLPFPMLDLGVPQLKALIAVPPTYEIVAGESRENKDARIILNLFSSGQRGLFTKTAEEFLKSYPKSNYEEIIRYMLADSTFDIYRAGQDENDFENAMSQYLSLAEKYPESPLTPRTLLLIGYSYLDRADSFGALKAFQKFNRLFPKSKQVDRVNISIAESYLRLNRFDDALAILAEVEAKGATEKIRQEAAFRAGDAFFRKKDYPTAVLKYQAAIKRFPEGSALFPNAWYNIAESEFVQKKYRESLESYRQFLRKFPDHEHGGYAMTRMGELLDILGADKKRVIGAFMESNFRFRSTPGAGIARIRLLTSRMTEMKDKELASALTEISEISSKYTERVQDSEKKEGAEVVHADTKPEEKKEEAAAEHGDAGHGAKKAAMQLVPKEGQEIIKKLVLPGIEEFTTLLIADGFTARGEFDTATKNLISYYQKYPQSPNREKFRSRIVNNMTSAIRADVDKGDFMRALRGYSKNTSGWLKGVNRVDLRYSLGRAYEQAGVFKEAATIYADALKVLEGFNEKEAAEHRVFEKMPEADTLRLRLAAVADKEKDYLAAESQLKKIAQSKTLTDAEKIERAEVAADVSEARGQSDIALKYLSDLIAAWKGSPELTSPLHLRTAKLLKAQNKSKEADDHLAQVIEWRDKDAASVSDDHYAQALEMRGDLFVSRGKPKDAVATLKTLLEKFEETRPLASVRYRLGQILYQDGDLKEAAQVWGDFKNKDGKDGLWQKLASEQMQSAKWQNEYKKYLTRIPAAAEIRE